MDDLFEESLRARESVAQAFRRALPRLLPLTGACAAVVTTLNEELQNQTFHAGALGGRLGQLLATHRDGVHRVGDHTLVSQQLDVGGLEVGAMGLLFEGDRRSEGGRLVRLLDTVAEQLDTVLATVQTASEKHQVLVALNQSLAHQVFELGMDQAVHVLTEHVRLPGFMLVYRDAVDPTQLHYRVYADGRPRSHSRENPDPVLEAVLRARGEAVVRADDGALREALGHQRAVESVLIAGPRGGRTLGKILVWSNDEGFSAFTLDLLNLLCLGLSQRLVDYHRERAHLAHFFPSRVIDELLENPDYTARYLSARDEEVGILFADINAFTRICEQVLEKPVRIGEFVDDWSQGVVELLFEHGGVFDKMVGDCVIGLFGPPFFRTSRRERAEATLRAAVAIQDFTREQMKGHPEVARISERIQVPGLGVAIGVNLAPTYCGLFGPNQQYTGFSTGMNQTARLQSLGGFRETLVMASLKEAVGDEWRFGPLLETSVKNVAQPLRYYKLL